MRSVYLFIIDCLRADYVGKRQDGSTLTPNMDELARDSVTFDNAVSQATWSKNAGAALLTGLYPAATGVLPSVLDNEYMNTNDYRDAAISPDVSLTLAALANQNGFVSRAFSANPYFSARYNMTRDFSVAPSMYLDPVLSRRWAAGEELANRLGRKALPIITLHDLLTVMQQHKLTSDHMSVIWAMDTHPPLYDREAADRVHEVADNEIINNIASSADNLEHARSLYSSCVQYVDTQIGQFLNLLRANGQYEDAMIIITADHGESFGEHQIFGHSAFPYEQLVNIPLIIKFPTNRFAGTKVGELVGLIDILPTIADVYGISIPQEIHGKSVIPTIKTGEAAHEFLIIHDQTRNSHWEYFGIRSKTRKLILKTPISPNDSDSLLGMVRAEVTLLAKLLKIRDWQKRRRILRRMVDLFRVVRNLKEEAELFDLEIDHEETENLIDSDEYERFIDEALSAKSQYLAAIRSYIKMNDIQYEEADVDERLLLHLKDLGYVE